MLADDDIVKSPAKNQFSVPFPPLEKIKNQQLKRPGNSKTDVVVPEPGGEPVAIRRAQDPR